MTATRLLLGITLLVFPACEPADEVLYDEICSVRLKTSGDAELDVDINGNDDDVDCWQISTQPGDMMLWTSEGDRVTLTLYEFIVGKLQSNLRADFSASIDGVQLGGDCRATIRQQLLDDSHAGYGYACGFADCEPSSPQGIRIETFDFCGQVRIWRDRAGESESAR